ncbi:hypothetical protein NEAUS05_1306 [Nematocida ausubeli]|nr:hypothetical protein NEAUS07_1130 [Nematocida ausubeli]KAI5148204.1 hypothetical protein NEAUS05_1306 [Nematocida ausubeli]
MVPVLKCLFFSLILYGNYLLFHDYFLTIFYSMCYSIILKQINENTPFLLLPIMHASVIVSIVYTFLPFLLVGYGLSYNILLYILYENYNQVIVHSIFFALSLYYFYKIGNSSLYLMFKNINCVFIFDIFRSLVVAETAVSFEYILISLIIWIFEKESLVNKLCIISIASRIFPFTALFILYAAKMVYYGSENILKSASMMLIILLVHLTISSILMDKKKKNLLIDYKIFINVSSVLGWKIFGSAGVLLGPLLLLSLLNLLKKEQDVQGILQEVETKMPAKTCKKVNKAYDVMRKSK